MPFLDIVGLSLRTFYECACMFFCLIWVLGECWEPSQPLTTVYLSQPSTSMLNIWLTMCHNLFIFVKVAVILVTIDVLKQKQIPSIRKMPGNTVGFWFSTCRLMCSEKIPIFTCIVFFNSCSFFIWMWGERAKGGMGKSHLRERGIIMWKKGQGFSTQLSKGSYTAGGHTPRRF